MTKFKDLTKNEIEKIKNKHVYKVVINKGSGFTSFNKEFDNMQEACDYALPFDNVEIYKNNRIIF